MNNELTEFNTGGTHSQNKLGGIPQGMDQNGQLNTVEEGETKKDNFIYSDRIKLTPELVSQFNLPKVLANKTAAEATKIINTKFEGRNSTIDNSTKKAMLDRIAEAQETVKQIEAQKQAEIAEALNMNSTMNPEDQMEGQIPQGMEEFLPQEQMMYGGKLRQNQMFFGGDSQQGEMAGEFASQIGIQAADMIAPGSGQFLKMGEQFGTQIGSLIGDKRGEQIGQLINPMGTIKGLGTALSTGNLNDIPGIGIFGGKTTKQKELDKARLNQDLLFSNKKISNFKFGGNMYNNGGPFDKSMASYDATKINPLQSLDNNILKGLSGLNRGIYNDPYKDRTISLTPEQLNEPSGWHEKPSIVPENTTTSEQTKMGKVLSKTGEFMKDNYGNILRYSPVAMNALQLHKLNKAGYDTVNPIINNTRYNPQYMDEKALVNQINAESNYAGNALANASNGSMGALRSNILASQLAKTKGLSDAYSRVAEVNRNENKTGQQFNLGVDEANIARRVAAEDKTAMNKGNWETNKSRLLGQIGTDLGNIGKEEVYKKLAKESFGYTWDGKYYVGPKGDKLTTQQMESKIDNEVNKNTTNQNRFGGYIMSKNFKK